MKKSRFTTGQIIGIIERTEAGNKVGDIKLRLNRSRRIGNGKHSSHSSFSPTSTYQHSQCADTH
jgi:hypothetical protein